MQPASFDVVLQSFSLHHLTAEGKQHFLRLVHRALRPGGSMVWIDIFSPVRRVTVQKMQRMDGDDGGSRKGGSTHASCPVPRCLGLSQEEDGDDVEPYRRRVQARCAALLSPEDQITVTDHANAFDLPERISCMRKMAEAAGFTCLDVLASNGNLCAALAMIKAA